MALAWVAHYISILRPQSYFLLYIRWQTHIGNDLMRVLMLSKNCLLLPNLNIVKDRKG